MLNTIHSLKETAFQLELAPVFVGNGPNNNITRDTCTLNQRLISCSEHNTPKIVPFVYNTEKVELKQHSLRTTDALELNLCGTLRSASQATGDCNEEHGCKLCPFLIPMESMGLSGNVLLCGNLRI